MARPQQTGDASDLPRMAGDVVKRLAALRLTLTTAESCTGGALAAVITEAPGCGGVFQGGFVCYAKHAKETLLGVSPSLMSAESAVSRRVAEAMARGALERLDSDFAVAVTGVAGPAPDEDGNPVGLVHTAIVSRAGNVDHLEQRLEGVPPQALRQAVLVGAIRLLSETVERRSAPDVAASDAGIRNHQAPEGFARGGAHATRKG